VFSFLTSIWDACGRVHRPGVPDWDDAEGAAKQSRLKMAMAEHAKPLTLNIGTRPFLRLRAELRLGDDVLVRFGAGKHKGPAAFNGQ
jgi:hypothetical protein